MQNDFASFLHNPFGHYTKEETTVVLIFKRKSRFIDGYDIDIEIMELMKQFFGNVDTLHRDGLTTHYNKLKSYIIEHDLIGLVRYGADFSHDISNTIINRYTQTNGIRLNLTIGSICSRLLKEYFDIFTEKDQNQGQINSIINKQGGEYVNYLYRKTPNFEIYYNVE